MDRKYIERKRIYSGPYSDVYSARDTSSNSVVCLKIVDGDFNMKPHDIRKEISLLKSLRHESIVPLIGDYTWIDDIVMVMPMYKYTLNTLLPIKYGKKRVKHDLENPMNPPKYITQNIVTDKEVTPMLSKLAAALAYVHSMGVIHRDIKPSNIFFMDEDLTEPVLGDFGISYDTRDTSQTTNEPPNRKYTDVCSGIYKPVELCLGKADYSYELDIWSLGICMTYVYSRNFKSILEEEDDTERVVNDLYLINSVFNVFGTPHVKSRGDDVNDKLYWPELDSDSYHFTSFQFVEQPRKSMSEIFPLCNSGSVLGLLDQMMIYDKRRISSGELAQGLSKLQDLSGSQ